MISASVYEKHSASGPLLESPVNELTHTLKKERAEERESAIGRIGFHEVHKTIRN